MPDNVTLEMLYKNQVGIIVCIAVILLFTLFIFFIKFSSLVKCEDKISELLKENDKLKQINFDLLKDKIDKSVEDFNKGGRKKW